MRPISFVGDQLLDRRTRSLLLQQPGLLIEALQRTQFLLSSEFRCVNGGLQLIHFPSEVKLTLIHAFLLAKPNTSTVEFSFTRFGVLGALLRSRKPKFWFPKIWGIKCATTGRPRREIDLLLNARRADPSARGLGAPDAGCDGLRGRAWIDPTSRELLDLTIVGRTRFAHDSALEEAGFELTVPP
jgi:hypothetical protein